MAKQVINVGTAKNDGSGDTLRVGAQKINDNFTELYSALGATDGQLSLVSQLRAGPGIEVSASTGNVLVSNAKATTISLGGIIVGDNLLIDNDGVLSAIPGNYTLPIATGGTLGGIKIGTSLTISETGVVNVADDFYTLPTATSNTLGGIKVGARLTITNGVLSADVQSIPTATTSVKGGVIVDGITIGINGSGVISVLSAGSSLTNGDATVSLSAQGVLSLPVGGDIVDSNGISVLGGGADLGLLKISASTIGTKDDPDTGNWGSYNLYLDPGGESYSYIQIPSVAGQTTGATLVIANNNVGNGGIRLSVNSGEFIFTDTGIDLPYNLPVRQNNSWTRVTTPLVNIGAGTVVWSSIVDYISSAKLIIQVECSEVGDASGWHSQVCEAIISARGFAGSGPTGDPQMVVYGIVHTSTNPLVTFTVQRNPITKLVEVVGTLTAAAAGAADLRIHSVELSTRD